jgi:ParB-like nuclease domain
MKSQIAIKRLRIDEIISTGRLFDIVEKNVAALAASMSEIGLLTPVMVADVDGAFHLVSGSHRIEAAKSLKWTHIDCYVTTGSFAVLGMKQIDENIVRFGVTVAQRRMMQKQRENYWEVKQVEDGVKIGQGHNVKRGNRHMTAEERAERDGEILEDDDMSSSSTNYAADAAKVLPFAVTTIREDVRLGNDFIEALGEDKAAEIATTKLGTHDGMKAVIKAAKKGGRDGAVAFADAHKDTGVKREKKPEKNAIPAAPVIETLTLRDEIIAWLDRGSSLLARCNEDDADYMVTEIERRFVK